MKTLERYPLGMLRQQSLNKILAILEREFVIRNWNKSWEQDYDESIIDRIERVREEKVLAWQKENDPQWYKRKIEAKNEKLS